MIRTSRLSVVAMLLMASMNTASFAGVVADELEASGGYTIGLAGGGAAALEDLSAVKANPAMLASSTRYQLHASYFWPSYGRPFYQLGIVDGTSKKVSAGVIYTSYGDDIQDPYKVGISEEERLSALYDSKTKKKISLALASTFGKIAAGITGTHIEGSLYDITTSSYSEKKSLTVGFGLAALVTRAFRVGISAENLNNADVENLAPTFKRASMAFLADGGSVSIHGDFVERQRVASEFENASTITDLLSSGVSSDSQTEISNEKIERSAIISATAAIQNMLRLSVGYAQEVETGNRSQLGAGIAIVSEGYTLGYQVSNPYLSQNQLKQTVSLSVDMKM